MTGALLKVAGAGENYPPEDCAAGGGNIVVASRRFHLVSSDPVMGRKFFAAPSYSDIDLARTWVACCRLSMRIRPSSSRFDRCKGRASF